MNQLSADSIRVVRPLFQEEGDGSRPISALHVRSFRVEPCRLDAIRSFIETWHYSRDVNGVKWDHCFRLVTTEGRMIGAAIFGVLAMVNQFKKYVDDESEIVELRRFCCSDDAPKNSESFFLSKCLMFLRKHTKVRVVLSYADMEEGHQGIIYKAANFQCKGETAKSKIIKYKGKSYHDHAVRTKYNGRLKPFAAELKHALYTGAATYGERKGKIAYVYEILPPRKRSTEWLGE